MEVKKCAQRKERGGQRESGIDGRKRKKKEKSKTEEWKGEKGMMKEKTKIEGMKRK